MSSRQSKKPTEQNLETTTIIEEKTIKPNGDIRSKKQSKGRFLGKGGFARCYAFTDLDNKKVNAAKIVAKSSLIKSRAKQKLMSEIKIHRALNHNNIVKFEHFFEDPEYVYIILELCTNQTINELLRRRKRLAEIEVQCQCIQIISAIRQLHAHRVIHRDLKLGNLFLSEKMEIKIGDFGLACKLEFDDEKRKTICGTPNYIAPEILDGKQGHSYEVDIWSLGVIIYTLLVGKPPFETSDVKTTYRRIKMNAYSFPEHVTLSDQSKSLITKILQTDPIKRPNIDEILAHDFFHMGNSVPKVLPASTLACPPSQAYIKQFIGNNNNLLNVNNVGQSSRLENTAPVNIDKLMNNNNNKLVDVKSSKNLMNTDRVSNNNNLMNPSQSVPVLNKDGSKSHRPYNNNNTNSNQKIETKNPNNDNKYIKSTSCSSYDPQLMDGKGGLAVDKGPEVWVKKWVDYSSKYGLGQLLSNGCAGVFFNDSSKIVLDPSGKQFEQMERKQMDKNEELHKYNFKNYPKEMQKKVTLLQHFRSYLEGQEKKISDGETEIPNDKQLYYVKKWMRTKHAIMFRLSNKIVQVNFQDRTEIILSSESRVVTQVNKKGERSTHPLTSALESSNLEMSKRLKQTKDILTHMLTANITGNQQSNVATTNRESGGTGAQNGTSPLTQRNNQ